MVLLKITMWFETNADRKSKCLKKNRFMYTQVKERARSSTPLRSSWSYVGDEYSNHSPYLKSKFRHSFSYTNLSITIRAHFTIQQKIHPCLHPSFVFFFFFCFFSIIDSVCAFFISFSLGSFMSRTDCLILIFLVKMNGSLRIIFALVLLNYYHS